MTEQKKPPMVDQKPFMVNAVVEWIMASDQTPYILVDCAHPDVVVPQAHINKDNNTIVLNLSSTSAVGLELTDVAYIFSTRFKGKIESIYVPIDAIGAAYSKESGAGTGFDVRIPKEQEPDLAKGCSLSSISSDGVKKPTQDTNVKHKKPALTLV
jgi:stringent starvation protein B